MDDHISDRGHLACDLKWRLAATRGIIIFPRCNSFHFSKYLFSLIQTETNRTFNNRHQTVYVLDLLYIYKPFQTGSQSDWFHSKPDFALYPTPFKNTGHHLKWYWFMCEILQLKGKSETAWCQTVCCQCVCYHHLLSIESYLIGKGSVCLQTILKDQNHINRKILCSSMTEVYKFLNDQHKWHVF